jgi:hypothetical protein
MDDIIDFAVYLTGHNTETIEKMYEDFVRYNKSINKN